MEQMMCPWETSYWFFSDNVPTLLYYSHLPVILIALLVGIYVVVKNRTSIIAKVLLAILALFSIWATIDIFLWATNRADLVIFWWSMQVLVEPLIYAIAFYLFYLYTFAKYPSIKLNLVIGLILLPLVIFVPTAYNLIGVNLYDCVAWESTFSIFYTYFLEALFIFGILVIAFRGLSTFKDKAVKLKITYFAFGLIAFLLAFTSGNIIGSITGNWDLAQYGLFGLPIFIGLLAYLIVQYKVFNLKLFGAQVLVIALWILIGSLLLVVESDSSRIVALITLALSVGFGYFLVRSVKREIVLREALQVANEGQANLIHIINHQIKGYLSKARNIFSELLTDNGYGPIPDQAKPMLDEGFKSLTEGVGFVKDFLDAANIEKGSYEYNMETLDFKALALNVAEKQKGTAEKKGLSFEVNIAEGNYKLKGDKAQLGQAVRNLIDNSIRYTPKGTINIQLTTNNNKVLFTVKDTGVGISDELKPKLFTKNGRDKNSLKININSTGFGLAFVKGVVVAHHGRVWAESAGPNKGSTFYMELPVS